MPGVSRTKLNPPKGPATVEFSGFNFRFDDLVDDDRFNRVLWLAIKGDQPYPGPTRMTASGSRPSAPSSSLLEDPSRTEGD